MNKTKRKALKRAEARKLERAQRRVVVGVRHRRFGYWQEETDVLLAEKRRETKGKQKKPTPGYFINEYGFEQPLSTHPNQRIRASRRPDPTPELLF